MNNENTSQRIKNLKLNSIKKIILFKEISEKSVQDIINNSELVNFDVGQIISQQDKIPKNINIILQGTARSLLRYNNKDITYAKLGPQSAIGLGSFLSSSACEEVIASSNVTSLSIPLDLIISLYEKEKDFKTLCDSKLFPCEISEITLKLANKSSRTDISIRTAFNILYKNSKLLQFSQSGKVKYEENIQALIGSSNFFNKKISDIIEKDEELDCNNKLPTRIIGIPTILYQEFFQKTKQKKDLSEENLSDNSDINSAPIVPEKSDINFGEVNKRRENDFIKAKGLIPEIIACFQMLALELEIPFRKDSVEKLLRDEMRSKKEISIESLGAITTILGLYSWGKLIPTKFISRLTTPSIIPWKNSFVLVKESSVEGLIVASPSSGIINISSKELESIYPQGIPTIFIEKSNLTPNKKFNLEWFLPAIKKFKSSLLLVLIASFIVQLFGLANPLLIQVIIDKVISQRSLDTLQILGFALIVVTILGGILGSLRTFLFTETTNRIDTRLGAEVIDHLLRLPLGYFDRRPVGELGSRVGELEKIRDFLTGQALTTVLDALFSIIYIIVMFIYSVQLTFIALAVIPIQTIITLLGSPLLRRQIREVAQQNAKTQSHLIEVLTGVQTVKAQNIETVSRWKWQDLYTVYISKTFEKVITVTALNQLSTVLQQLSQLMVLWVGASLVLNGNLTLGQLIAFRIISGYVTQPLLRLSTIWQNIQELKVSFERLADIIDTPEESNESDKSNIALPQIEGNIKFENVTFSFLKNSRNILNNINLSIKNGTFVGIAGESGSGKSTLVKLISRLYEIDSGRILIDNYDIKKTELYSLRRQIGIVPQDPLLFSGTITENIAITNPDIGSDEIIKSAKIANAHDFIMELPQGYSTKVGERGASLSGGQRQRIAIARTLLTNPRLIIMDEATSALDYQTERIVCDNLRMSRQNTTVLFITHRLNTIKNADVIVMMDDGSIEEIGNHDQLLKKEGRYYALFMQQDAN